MSLIEKSIETLKQGIITLTTELNCPPEVICIARSDEDEYTNPEMATAIQQMVMSMLDTLARNVWSDKAQVDCNHTSRSSVVNRNKQYKIVYKDVRDNCYEQSRSVFIDDSVISSDECRDKKRKLLQQSGYI
jgi:hypothetical protein